MMIRRLFLIIRLSVLRIAILRKCLPSSSCQDESQNKLYLQEEGCCWSSLALQLLNEFHLYAEDVKALAFDLASWAELEESASRLYPIGFCCWGLDDNRQGDRKHPPALAYNQCCQTKRTYPLFSLFYDHSEPLHFLFFCSKSMPLVIVILTSSVVIPNELR
ncbi:hypothetical protein EDC96DRAFT_548926 [Choanephora cucurbitarum]|nr:hypothetical protein EDC96DRAFT_548926 [Choanephora cucurbitarum]